jgi:DNA-binding NtrC family response regulator/tetratricopeptide (TPR) repeat protein
MQHPIDSAALALSGSLEQRPEARARTLGKPSLHAACFGRDVELARLCSTYDLVTRQGGRLVLLEGPSGVGKGQLLQAFRTKIRLDGGVVLEGRCEPGQAFGPFAEVVERALRFLEEVGQTPGDSVAHLACREGCHPFWYQHRGLREHGAAHRTDDHVVLEQRLSFFDAIGGLLRDVAKLRVPVVILHGLERADRGTLELVRYLLEGAGPWNDGLEGPLVRALFVASVRTDITDELALALQPIRQHAGTIPLALGQLDPEGVRAYLQSPETIARIIERTGGHPEAIDLLLHGDPLTPEARVARLLASIGGPARMLAEALAVIEHPADAELLARIAGGAAPDASALQAFGASELIERSVSDGHIVFSFVRERDREHVYSLLSEARRIELHRRAMDEFAGRPGAEQYAAHHGMLAGELERAIPFARAAAAALAARHAHAEAAALLERIVDRAGGGASTELRDYLADLYRLAGDYKQALVHARALRDESPHSATATRRLGELLRLAGHLDEAAARLSDARRLAASTDDPCAVAEVDAQLAELHFRLGSYGEGERHATLAIEAARAVGDVVVELDGRNALGKIAAARREASAAASLFEENRALAVKLGLRHQEAQALTNLGVALLRAQDLPGAERAFGEAILVARAATDTRDYAIATENLAVLAHLKRDYARAQTLYHEAVALLKRLGNRAMLARAAMNLGELYLSLGERSRAHTLCEFASHVGGVGVPPIVAAEILVLRGRIESARGSIGTARAAFQAARETYARLGDSQEATPIIELARTALTEGDVPGARQLLLELPLQESPKRACEIALVASEIDRLRGEAGASSARRALDLAEQSKDTELMLRALLALARAHLDHGDTDAVAGLLARAEAIETELTSKVPEESMASWVVRPERAELGDLTARLANRAPETRRSSVPPAPRTSRTVSQDRQRWSKLYPDLVGDSAAMNQVRTLLDKVAPTDALVLVRGESGTGKELIAEALHNNSPRKNRPLVKVNCAALVETLLLSELFGHERGAFTGANARKKGRFELADGGTIFLDEIGDISPKTQVALLRVLQERQFERVGGTQPIRVDVRIIAATHRDLEAMVREGSFREDLYYRLRGVMVELPPLRNRLDDLPAVAQHLLDRIAAERGEQARSLSPEARDLLVRHRWPGNVRELENVLRSATLFAESSTLEAHDFAAFREVFAEAPEPETSAAAEPSDLEAMLYHRVRRGDSSLFEMKKALERECIVRALRETDGNITQAAALLGMKRPRLSQLVKQYGLQTAGEAE